MISYMIDKQVRGSTNRFVLLANLIDKQVRQNKEPLTIRSHQLCLCCNV